MSDPQYKIFGLVSIFLLWMGFLILLKKWPGNRSMSISQHAAQNRRALLFLAISSIVPLLLFYIFTTQWLMPKLELGGLFRTALNLTIVTQVLAVLIPETGGKKQKTIHRILGYSAAFMWLVMLTIIAVSAELMAVVLVVTAVAIITMLAIVLLFYFRPKTHDDHLVYQITYFLLCDIAFIAIIVSI